MTPEGQFVAALLMCAGVGLFGMISGLLAAWFVAPIATQGHNELEGLREDIRTIKALLEEQAEAKR